MGRSVRLHQGEKRVNHWHLVRFVDELEPPHLNLADPVVAADLGGWRQFAAGKEVFVSGAIPRAQWPKGMSEHKPGCDCEYAFMTLDGAFVCRRMLEMD